MIIMVHNYNYNDIIIIIIIMNIKIAVQKLYVELVHGGLVVGFYVVTVARWGLIFYSIFTHLNFFTATVLILTQKSKIIQSSKLLLLKKL